MKKMLIFSGLFCLTVVGSVIGQTAQRSSNPNVAVVIITSPKNPTLEATLMGSFQNAISRSGRFELVGRGEDLTAVLKEDALQLSGVTVGSKSQLKKVNADQLLVVNASSLSGASFSAAATIDVLTKLIAVGTSKIDSNSVDLISITKDNARDAGSRWWNTYSTRAPLEGRITATLPNLMIDLGKKQRLGEVYSQGKIVRREKAGTPTEKDLFIADFVIDQNTLGDLNSGINLLASDSKTVPQVGDLVQLGPLVRQSQEARDLIGLKSDLSASLTVQYADGSSIRDFKVREGEKVQLEFGVPNMAGFPYVLSFFPNEKDFYLLYPYQSASKKLTLGRSQIFPGKNDLFELVAQKPYGPTLVKLLVTREPIPAFENQAENQMGAAQAKTVNDLLRNQKAKWASASVMFEVRP